MASPASSSWSSTETTRSNSNPLFDDIEALPPRSNSLSSTSSHYIPRDGKAPSVTSAEVISIIDDDTSEDSNDNRGRDGTDENPASRLFRFDHLDRQLKREHITGIAFSGTIGIGLFISSGEIISLSGSAGCVLGYIGAGFIVIGVMRSLAEMVSLRPVFSALIDYPHTFVDPALGFAVGAIYCLAQCFSMATLMSAAARVANNFHPDNALSKGQTAAIIVGLFIITLLSNACGVRMYGNLERIFKWIKMLVIAALCILMIVVNATKTTKPNESRTANMTEHGIVPYFKPDGFDKINETQPLTGMHGIPGTSGRFLSVWTAITLAVFGCMGGDMVIVAAGEAKTPRKDLPAVARFMYLFPVGCYILASFLVGFNINYADTYLYKPYAIPANTSHPFTSHSPFVITLSTSSIGPKVLPNLFSALFLFSAYSAANTALFMSSRTLFALARIYGNKFLKRTFGRTNQGHTPLTAIVVCSLFGLLAFLGLADDTFDQPILSLSSFFTGSIACVYVAECISYLRFKQGLNARHKEGLFSRDDAEYKKKYYRPHGQPIWAIIGLVGSALIMIFSGWPPIYIVSARSMLDQAGTLKPTNLLAWDLVGAYSGPILFFTLYIGYKMIYGTQIRTLDSFHSSYFPIEFDNNPEDQPDEKAPKGWRYWLPEIWSFIK